MQPVEPSPLITETLQLIELQARQLSLRIRAFVARQDQVYHSRAQTFLSRYAALLASQGLTLADGVASFVRLHHIVEEEREKFLQTGRYPNTSFDEVNRTFYSNPELMRHHMHGLVFAQFLWPDQYRRFDFFSSGIEKYGAGVRDYLEVGGGHALYLLEALRVIGSHASIQVVDISETSMAMAKCIANSPDIRFHLMNIFDFPDAPAFDFITMGEVIEHVEEPAELLKKVRDLLRPGGIAYITTPANAPMPDHIYLFRNADEIRQMLTGCGLRIQEEALAYAINISPAMAEKLKLPLMYAAFVTPA